MNVEGKFSYQHNQSVFLIQNSEFYCVLNISRTVIKMTLDLVWTPLQWQEKNADLMKVWSVDTNRTITPKKELRKALVGGPELCQRGKKMGEILHLIYTNKKPNKHKWTKGLGHEKLGKKKIPQFNWDRDRYLSTVCGEVIQANWYHWNHYEKKSKESLSRGRREGNRRSFGGNVVKI